MQSWGGALCSLFLFITITAYSFQKLDVLFNGRDVDLIVSMKTNALQSHDEFDASMGLNFAAALTAYDDNEEPIDDPTFGELVFNHHKWGRNSDGSIFASGRYRIKSHRCTSEELGVSKSTDASSLFSMDERYLTDFKFYQKKFFCPDQKDLRIYGDFNTASAQLLNVQFIKCHDRPDCKTPEEITQFLRTKFIMIAYN